MSLAKHWSRKRPLPSQVWSYSSFIYDANVENSDDRCGAQCPHVVGSSTFFCARPKNHPGETHANHLSTLKVDWNVRGFLNVTGDDS